MHSHKDQYEAKILMPDKNLVAKIASKEREQVMELVKSWAMNNNCDIHFHWL